MSTRKKASRSKLRKIFKPDVVYELDEEPIVQLYNGDCLAVLAEMPENSVDSIVTDPHYGLSFMGSGSTGIAAVLEGRRFVRIDINNAYLEIADRRIGKIIYNVYGDA